MLRGRCIRLESDGEPILLCTRICPLSGARVPGAGRRCDILMSALTYPTRHVPAPLSASIRLDLHSLKSSLNSAEDLNNLRQTGF